MTTTEKTCSLARRTGDVQSWSRTLIPTTREAPTDAEMPSHIFLTRAGFIRKVAAGVYDYLPLMWRSITKLNAIVREELNAKGASELLLPALEPIEFMKATGRAEAYGDDLFTLSDRHGRTQALAPTHEETIVEMVKGSVSSYKSLPINLYQIQTKFRDEVRPRSGLLRGREFIMKDAYSFHLKIDDEGGLSETYDWMHEAYSRIFTRCGLDFSVVEAEAGPIGGSASHEFMVNCENGEDKVLRCPKTGYAANVEKCEIGERPWSFDAAPSGELTKIHTPGKPDITSVAEHLKIPASQMLKTIVLSPEGPEEAAGCDWVLAVVRGDHDVNTGKVRDALGFGVALADEKVARQAGFAIGFVSPRMVNGAPGTASGDAASLCKVRLVVDPDATASAGKPWATGADLKDNHVIGFDWKRDVGEALNDDKRVTVADIRNAVAGDPSPRAAGVLLEESRGIEVGHIFKLGTKYSDAMGLSILDENQKRQSVIMGCYGIGITRTLAACVEMSHDDNGIIWPIPLAPYHVLIVMMKHDELAHQQHASRIARDLSAQGIDVLIDDRKDRPGVKFKDADLIGVPLRITLGDKALAEDSVEFKRRSESGKGNLVPLDQIVSVCVDVIEEACAGH